MQLTSFIIIAAIAISAINAAPLNVNRQELPALPAFPGFPAAPAPPAPPAPPAAPALPALPVLRRQTAPSINSQAQDAQSSASSGLAQAMNAMKALDVNTVTLDQLQPVVAMITSAITPASQTFSNLAAQSKPSASKRQGPDLNRAVDVLVVDLNKTLMTLTPLVAHLTANLDLGTVQDLVIALTPTLTTLILGVEGLLITLAPGLSTIVDPLLVTVYGLTDSLGINLNLPAPSA